MEFYAIDVETTGLDSARDEIIEVAWAHFSDGELRGTFTSLLHPTRQPSDEILNLTGITWEELAEAPAPKAVLTEALQVLANQVVVAHNAPFDRGFLERAAAGLNAPLPAYWVDTLALSRAVWPQEASHSLAAVRRRLGLQQGPAHRALPDAVAAGWVLTEALAQAARFPEGARKAVSSLLPGWASRWVIPAAPAEEVPPLRRPPVHDLDQAFDRLQELPSWQDRAGQRDYADSVEKTLSKGGVTFLEAGPGTGKTLGYLVPVLLHLTAPKARIAVATRTRALQEQLWHKDLPAALTQLGLDVPTALLKGRENYLCLRRLEEARGGLVGSDVLNTVLVWAERTRSGDLDELAAVWAQPEGRQLLTTLRDTPHRCTRRACPFLAKCPSRRARERARDARLVVVNHALLAADAAAGGVILGRLDALVVDEAHSLPAAARDAFTERVTPATVPSLLGELRRGKRGLLSAWAKEVNTDRAVALWEEVRASHRLVWNAILPGLPQEAAQYGPSQVAPAQAPGQQLHHALTELSQELAHLGQQAEGETTELAKGLSLKAQELAESWCLLLRPEGEERVFWHSKEAGMPCLKTSPVELGPLLEQGLWSRLPAAVLTSATLSGGEGVAPLALELGLTAAELNWNHWPSPFPYRNVQACVPSFLPRPDHRTYPSKLGNLLRRLALEGGRRTMALFTSRNMLEATLPHLQGVPTLVQGRDGERDQLVRRFRNEMPPVVLMGLDTFWEGVDLPGEQVEAVVIPRLPFPVPGDPLVQAEAERMRGEGRDPFRFLFLPRAVLRLRQGAGRLVRAPQDRGLLVIADPRTLTESYGVQFLQSLPMPAQVAEAPEELLAILHQVLEEPKGSPEGRGL
ncbi:MAG: helicase C-terminal domain-containing protein [Candidatus Bipolaricaulota bacterium]